MILEVVPSTRAWFPASCCCADMRGRLGVLIGITRVLQLFGEIAPSCRVARAAPGLYAPWPDRSGASRPPHEAVRRGNRFRTSRTVWRAVPPTDPGDLASALVKPDQRCPTFTNCVSSAPIETTVPEIWGVNLTTLPLT